MNLEAEIPFHDRHLEMVVVGMFVVMLVVNDDGVCCGDHGVGSESGDISKLNFLLAYNDLLIWPILPTYL